MQLRLFHVVVFGSALLTAAVPASGQATSKCRPADATSANLITALKKWVTTTNSKRIFERDNYFHVPVVSVSQISLVTDERTCGKAIQAYSAMPSGYTPASLTVVKLGNKGFATIDPLNKAGQFAVVFIFDTKWVDIGGWTGG
jgi:hypothetical protein